MCCINPDSQSTLVFFFAAFIYTQSSTRHSINNSDFWTCIDFFSVTCADDTSHLIVVNEESVQFIQLIQTNGRIFIRFEGGSIEGPVQGTLR